MKSYRFIVSISVVTLAIVTALALSTGPAAAQQGPATSRSIQEFIDAQGTLCVLPPGATDCVRLIEDVPILIHYPDAAAGRQVWIDYAGHSAAYIEEQGGPSLGTTFEGTITERPLADGRAEIHVRLKTRNALTFVVAVDEPVFGTIGTAPLVFGGRPVDILEGVEPGLCDAYLHLKFINTAPGAPLPDAVQVYFMTQPGQEPLYMSMNCSATGPLREAFGVEDGTPGRATVKQLHFFNRQPDGTFVQRMVTTNIGLHEIGP
jgi:hypothetical protein